MDRDPGLILGREKTKKTQLPLSLYQCLNALCFPLSDHHTLVYSRIRKLEVTGDPKLLARSIFLWSEEERGCLPQATVHSRLMLTFTPVRTLAWIGGDIRPALELRADPTVQHNASRSIRSVSDVMQESLPLESSTGGETR